MPFSPVEKEALGDIGESFGRIGRQLLEISHEPDEDIPHQELTEVLESVAKHMAAIHREIGRLTQRQG